MTRNLLFILLLLSMPPSWAEAPLEPVRLQLQWKHQFQFAGFYAAKEKGFYAEAGLDVEFIEIETGLDPVEQVVSGQAEFAVGYSSVILDYLEGQPIVLLANFLKHSPVAIVAQPQIKIVRDLAGKRVMGIADSIDSITLRMMFDRFGLSTDAITSVAPTYSVKAFVDGEVDAMVVFTSNEIYDLEQAGKSYRLFDPTLFGSEYYDVNLITSRAQLSKHPTRVKRFREASIRGWKYALANQSEIIALILERYNTQRKTEQSLRFEAEQISRAVMAEVDEVGSFDLQRLKMIGADLVQLGMLPRTTAADFEGLVYREPSAALELSTTEQEYLSRRGPIRFCADPDWMPFERISEGKLLGMSADYMRLISAKISTPMQLVPTRSWAESLAFAEQRRCDMLTLAMSTPDRRVHLNFTEPYLRFPLVIATRMDTFFIPSIDRVADRKLGIVKDYAFAELLRRNYPTIQLVETESLATGLQRVANGELFGFIDSLATIGYLLQKEYVGELKIAGKFEEQWELGIGVRNDDPVLLGVLQKVLDSITPAEHRAIANDWISVTFEEGQDYGLVVKILIAVAVIVGLFLYHGYIQSRFVSKLQAANAEIQEKNRQLRDLSTIDKLTGLYNRLKLEELLERDAEQFRRYQQTFSVILIDVDLFKEVNDTFGHLEGDRVLAEIAGLLLSCTRKSDAVGRWGGEEFLVLCTNTNQAEATKLAEKLRQRVRNADLGLGRAKTISLGVAEISQDQPLGNLLSMADDALYAAKHGGRDRIATA